MSSTLFLGCKTVTRSEVEATVWLNNLPLPKEICDASPELKLRGFYRLLNDGKYEIVSVCNPSITEFVEMPKDDFNRILDALLPKPNNP